MEEEIQHHSKVIVKINGNFWNELSFKPVKLQIWKWKDMIMESTMEEDWH